MDKVDAKEVLETICDAKKYSLSLDLLKNDLHIAEKQILNSARVAEKEIEVIFTNLLSSITKTLETRKMNLIENTRAIRDQSLEPIKSSQLVITEKLQETNKLIELSKKINDFNLDEFIGKSSRLGSLPEVPQLKEVSFITFQFDHKVETEILYNCQNFGLVSRIAPAQIKSLTPKPGAISVEWEIIDSDEPFMEIQEYHLQKALGNSKINKDVIYYDCYKGDELQYLVQDLKPLQEYSFRIRCKFEGCNDFSPWSAVEVGSTPIKAYSWLNNSNFKLTNENKIASPINNHDCSIISDGPQFQVGNTLDFTFIEATPEAKGNYIGLILLDETKQDFNLNPNTEGAFLFEASGEVYINGSLKSTRLPPITKGLKVSFMCTAIHDDKLRMNIDVSDKRVTYDWNVESFKGIHFVAKFTSKAWKVLVE